MSGIVILLIIYFTIAKSPGEVHSEFMEHLVATQRTLGLYNNVCSSTNQMTHYRLIRVLFLQLLLL